MHNYKSMFKYIIVFVLTLTLFSQNSIQLFAQVYEAENATLSVGARIEQSSLASGGKYVALGEGSIVFDIELEKAGYFNVLLKKAGTYGDKSNDIVINGAYLSFFTKNGNEFKSHTILSGIPLEKGNQSISVRKSWGWIDVDYLELKEVTAKERFNINTELVTPNPTSQAYSLYHFLYDNYGEKIISGAMAGPTTGKSMEEVEWLKNNTGKEPGLLGLDFMHSGRNYSWYNDKEPIIDAKNYYERNGIPCFLWHWRDPSKKTEEFYTTGTSFDVSKIFDPSSEEYKVMIKDIDYISELLKELQDQDVPILWRPLHEAAGKWFWWGAKGPEACKKLWNVMFDRMVNHHGLRNLIWVWTREPQDDEGWYPGDDVVDIVGRDIYRQGDHSSQTMEFYAMNAVYGGKKMLAITECGSFPDPDNLVKDDIPWSFFMPWYGEQTRDPKHNPLLLWQKTLNHGHVLTLDEMPVLKNYVPEIVASTPDELFLNNEVRIYPTLVEGSLYIESCNENLDKAPFPFFLRLVRNAPKVDVNRVSANQVYVSINAGTCIPTRVGIQAVIHPHCNTVFFSPFNIWSKVV